MILLLEFPMRGRFKNKFFFLMKGGPIMVTRKTIAVAFIPILITAWLVVFAIQVEAQTTEEQKQALIGEWTGMWPGYHQDISTLIIHEIDTEKAKAQCTYVVHGETVPVLADFTPGPKPKLEFKLEQAVLKFVLSKGVLSASVKGIVRGTYVSNATVMKKKPK
jgi:hypothetical protein